VHSYDGGERRLKSKQSTGVTATERMLADFCKRTFLTLWSYSNPYKEDGKELCDLLAVFGNYVFIFFDRASELSEAPDKDPQVLWDRWKRNVIDKQIKTAHGAEGYIRSGQPIFLDPKGANPFPFTFDREHAVIHKIIIAHGAKEACERASPENIYGSLAITYAEDDSWPTWPFQIKIDKSHPVHILDSHNMPIVLRELDTVSDFSAYLDEKIRAITALDCLAYCGEEDLLGHYLLNYDEEMKRHMIGPQTRSQNEQINGLMIGEGEWKGFIQTGLYKNTKNENRISYFWDDLIRRTCQNHLDGTLSGNSDPLRGQSAIYEMVKEPRFMRRGLSDKMRSAVEHFPETKTLTRQVTLLSSNEPNAAYVLLQLYAPDELRVEPDYREKRIAILEIACGAAKNKFPHLVKVIGIGIDAPKLLGNPGGEDFILIPCETWNDEQRSYYEEQNKNWNFFEKPELQKFEYHVTEFIPPIRPSTRTQSIKVGRNDPCPCGSGKKYKKCHG